MGNDSDKFEPPPFWTFNTKGYAVLCILCFIGPGLWQVFGSA